MKRVLILLFAPALAAAQTPVASLDTTARPISLDEAVRLAQRNAPQAVQARGQMKTTRAAVRSAYGSFIPSFSVGMSASQLQGDQFVSQLNEFRTVKSWQYGDGYNASLELFDGGRRFFQLGAARRDVDAAEANETLQRYNVALLVKQQYFNVLAARERESAAQAQLQQARQQYRAAAARVAAGAATKSDSLRSVIQVGNARLALVTARNSLIVANASLTRLVATPFTVTATPADTLDRAEIHFDSVDIARLAITGPAVRQAEAQLGSAKAATRASWTSYLPQVSASFNRGGNGADSRFGRGDTSFAYSNRLSINLSYPLFNQYQREEQVARAAVAEDNAEAALRDTRLLAEQSFVQYVGALRTAEERVNIQLASVAAAEEDLRVQQQRYALGASTLLDVLTSQTQLNTARADLIQARYDYRVARAQLEALIGRDLAPAAPQ
jgi:outer membrane protein